MLCFVLCSSWILSYKATNRLAGTKQIFVNSTKDFSLEDTVFSPSAFLNKESDELTEGFQLFTFNFDKNTVEHNFWKYYGDSIVDTTRNGAFRVPVGLAPGRIAAYTSYRPLNQRRMPYVCDSHTDEDNYQITVPTQLQITQLPEDTNFNDGERSYQSYYSLDKQVITVHRKLTTQMPSRVCNSEQYENWKKLLTVMRKDQQALIIFAVK